MKKKSCEISADAHVEIMKTIKPGQTEQDVETQYLYEFAKRGGRFSAYTPIVAGGENACVLHYVENSKPLLDGDLLLVDAGCEYDFYASDITRTFPVSGKFTDAQLAIYEVVLEAESKAIAAVSVNNNVMDAQIISEKVVREDRFTSIHIQELTCIARDTKLGSEEITSDIPNVGEGSLSKLDECGIVYVGAEVNPGDILVGKITPKGENQLSPEEKLLRAIFGEKASDVKDTSLRVPSSINGTVIGVEVFTRDGMEKDERTQSIEADHLSVAKKDADDQIKIINDATRIRLVDIIKGSKISKGPGLKKGSTPSADELSELSLDDLLSVRITDDSAVSYTHLTLPTKA